MEEQWLVLEKGKPNEEPKLRQIPHSTVSTSRKIERGKAQHLLQRRQ